jgi:hypothetical protein
MTNRIALAAGSAAAAVTLAVALAAAGFAPRPTVAADPASLTTSIDAAATTPAAAPTVLVDTIYVAPPAERQTITVTEGNGGEAEHDGEHDGEHESGDDD